MTSLSTKQKLGLVALVYLVINLIQSYFTPLIDDEAYYWMWSQHLDWGYFDHPPMVALWVKMGFALFQNELGVRLITALAAAEGFMILARLLKVETQQELVLYCSLFFSMLLFQAFGFITTPDSPLLFFGIMYVFYLKKFLEKDNWVNTLLWGTMMAMLMYSKYHGILLIVFSLIPLLPKLLKNKNFYIAVAFGILLYVPHLWWQYEHNFVSANYHLIRRNVHNHFKLSNTTDYLLSVVWTSMPLLFWFVGKALFRFRFKKADDFSRAMMSAFLGVVGFFLLVTLKRYIQAQWSLMAFIPLIILTYYYLKNQMKYLGIIKKLALATFCILVLGRVYFVVQDVPIKTQYHGWKDFMQRAGKVTEGIAVFEKYQWVSLFNFYNYPEKHAENYITIENRQSQYQLWASERKADGKEITYFSPYISSSDSLTVNSKRKNTFNYRKIDNFKSTDFLKMNIVNSEVKNDSIEMAVWIKSDKPQPLFLSEKEGFSLKMVYTQYEYSEDLKCTQNIDYSPFQIDRDSVLIQLKTRLCPVPPGDYLSYLAFVYDELPPKIQSNRISFEKK